MKEKIRLTAVFVGQAGCGKSTLLGHLLCTLGQVDPALLERTEIEAAARKKRSSKYAWVISHMLLTCILFVPGTSVHVGVYTLKPNIVTVSAFHGVINVEAC